MMLGLWSWQCKDKGRWRGNIREVINSDTESRVWSCLWGRCTSNRLALHEEDLILSIVS